MRRNLTLSEINIVRRSMPNLNVQNWMIRKKDLSSITLQHKETGTKRHVPVDWGK